MKHCECNTQTICKITKQCFTANSTEEHMFTCVQKETYIKAVQISLYLMAKTIHKTKKNSAKLLYICDNKLNASDAANSR